MPCFRDHEQIGGLVGGVAAFGFAAAANQPLLLALAETAGGILAGGSAGTWPDRLEPGVSSHHRDSAHALVPAAALSKLAFDRAVSVQGSFRAAAAMCFRVAETSGNGFESFFNLVAGLSLHMLAGAVPAVPAAYLSHLALDAPSPRGIPLLTRGF